MSSLSWRPWRRSWARCCANAALRLLGAPHSGARVSAYKRFGGAETLGPAEFISAGPFQLPQGPRQSAALPENGGSGCEEHPGGPGEGAGRGAALTPPLRLLGAPRSGARQRVQAFRRSRNLGPGGIHFRRAFPIAQGPPAEELPPPGNGGPGCQEHPGNSGERAGRGAALTPPSASYLPESPRRNDRRGLSVCRFSRRGTKFQGCGVFRKGIFRYTWSIETGLSPGFPPKIPHKGGPFL